jgi:hypothetical protein
LAEAFVRRMYDFGEGGRVFFRPTLAEAPCNFRTTFEGTLAYFIGGPGFPDTGFAKKHLLTATYSNKIEGRNGREGIRLLGHDTATAMGNVCLTEMVHRIEQPVVFDKVFVYRKVGTELKLMVHMSAVRNDPKKPAVE